MMSMQRSRKGCRIEKIENSTALQPSKRTCQKRDNKSDHACAIFAMAARRSLRGGRRWPACPLAGYESFRRGILSMLRGSAGALLTFAKVGPHRTKLLAMPRGAL